MHLLLAVCLAAVQVKYPPRPAQGQFVLDLAGAVDAGDEAEINRIAAETLREKRAPIHVVTLTSLAGMGAGDWPIERYAMNLFAEWGIGWPEWNHGMLLVVSVGDRKARIELGGGWGRRMDDNAQRIMERKIVPEFKRGRISPGVLEGVKGLRSMALGLGPPPGTDGGSPFERVPGAQRCGGGLTWIIVLVLAVVVMGSLFRRRTSAWGPGGMGGMSPGCGAFGSGCLGAALGNLFFGGLGGGFGGGGRGWGGGGGWSGGSRGGGFSGGGGATGSW